MEWRRAGPAKATNLGIASAYLSISGAYLGRIEAFVLAVYPRRLIARLVAGAGIVAIQNRDARRLDDPAASADLPTFMREVTASMTAYSSIALFIDGANLYATAK